MNRYNAFHPGGLRLDTEENPIQKKFPDFEFSDFFQ